MKSKSILHFVILAGFAMALTGVSVAQTGQSTAANTAPSTALASDAQRAQALLAKATAYYREKNEAALAAFSRQGDFIDGELYVYVMSTDGVMQASGGSSSALIGRDVSNLRDAAGNPFFREMLDKAKAGGTGTVEYRWLNRVDNKVERKIAYFEKIGDRIIAVGYYISRATPQQATAMLERAVQAVKADSSAAFAAFNELKGSYAEGDLYVFVVGLDDAHFRAHGVSPRLVGTDGNALRDPNGKPIIQQMIAALKTKDHGELDYAWRNPVTNKVENKHTSFRKVDGFLVGVGYYTR